MNQTKSTSTNQRNNDNLGTALNPSKNQFGQRAVQPGNAPQSWASTVFSQSFFFNAASRFLSTRTLSNLRLVCVDICRAIFGHNFFPLMMNVERLQLLHQHFLPRLYPAVSGSKPIAFKELPADAIVNNVRELQRVLSDSRFIIKSVVFEGSLEDVYDVLFALPPTIEHFEMSDIPLGAAIDLSGHTHLKSVKIGNKIAGKLILPSSIETFEGGVIAKDMDLSNYQQLKAVKIYKLEGALLKLAENITSFAAGILTENFDFSRYTHLKSVEVGEVHGIITLPPHIEAFKGELIASAEALPNLYECEQLLSVKLGTIPTVPPLPENIQVFEVGKTEAANILDLSSYEQLKHTKVGNVKNIILPKEIITFEGGDIGDPSTIADLRAYEQLQAVKVGKVHAIVLPKNILSFEGGEIGDQNTVLDLRAHKQIRSVKTEKMKGKLILPKGVVAEEKVAQKINAIQVVNPGVVLKPAEQTSKTFIYGDIPEGSTLDLSQHKRIASVQLGDIQGALVLPSIQHTLTTFECRDIDEGVVLDLTPYKNLSIVRVKDIYGTLILPPNVTSFECFRVKYNMIDFERSERDLNLSSYRHLSSVRINTFSSIGGNIILPSSTTNFECKEIEDLAELDLSPYTSLSAIKIDSLGGNLKLPTSITDFECLNLKKKYKLEPLDLSHCKKLSNIKLGDTERIVKLPVTETLTSLEWLLPASDQPNETFDFRGYPNLSSLKIETCHTVWGDYISHLNLLKLPKNLRQFQCGTIDENMVLDLSSCTNLSVVSIRSHKEFSFGRGGNDALINGILKLPPNIRRFEAGKINKNGTVDLSSCKDLSSIRVGDIKGKLQLPHNTHKLNSFRCFNIAEDISLDLTPYENLSKLNVSAIEGTLKFPPSVTEFSAYSIEKGVNMDLSSHSKLLSVDIYSLAGNLKLPPSLTDFKGKNNVSKDATLDVSSCINLSSVKVDWVDGTLKLPANITHLQCGPIHKGATLDLSSYTKLSTVSAGAIEINLKLPSSLTSFSFTRMDSKIILDLSHCTNLSTLKVYHEGTLKLSRLHHQHLSRSSNATIQWV